MAYATDCPYTEFNKIQIDDGLPLEHLEMSFAVGLYPQDKFQVHVGIARNPQYQGEKHEKISIPMHAFAAAAMTQVYPELELMVTKPANSMKKIMKDAFESCPDVYWDQSDGKQAGNDWVEETLNKGMPHLKVKNSGGRILVDTDEKTSSMYQFLTSLSVPYFAVEIEALAKSFFR